MDAKNKLKNRTQESFLVRFSDINASCFFKEKEDNKHPRQEMLDYFHSLGFENNKTYLAQIAWCEKRENGSRNYVLMIENDGRLRSWNKNIFLGAYAFDIL
jgi:hypothetical protein